MSGLDAKGAAGAAGIRRIVEELSFTDLIRLLSFYGVDSIGELVIALVADQLTSGLIDDDDEESGPVRAVRDALERSREQEAEAVAARQAQGQGQGQAARRSGPPARSRRARARRPSPVRYRRMDELAYYRQTRRAAVGQIDDLIRVARTGTPEQARRAMRHASLLRNTRARQRVFEGAVEARGAAVESYQKRRFWSAMRRTIGTGRLQASDREVAAYYRGWRDRNRDLLTTVPGRARTRIRALALDRDLTENREKLVEALRNEKRVATNNLKRITRDQVQKAVGESNSRRQQAAGIRTYVWQTAEDERVRPSHAELHGRTRRWTSTPIPGEEVNCRCVAIPNIRR